MLDFLIEGLFNLFGKGVTWALENIMKCFNTTPEQFQQIIPVLSNIPAVLAAVGWSMLLLLLVLSVIKSIMTPNDQMAEHPLSLVGRSIISGIFLLSYQSIFKIFFDWGTVVYESIGAISADSTLPYATPFSNFTELFTSAEKFGMAASVASVGSGVTALIGLIMLLIMAWQIIRFMLECLERFVTLHMTVYFAPLVAPTIVSKATATIFSSYLSFVVGQMMLWWMSMLFMKLVASGFDAFGRAGDPVGFFMRYFVLYSLIILAQKADNILAKLGFKNILGGAGTASSFIFTMMMAGRMAGKAVKQMIPGGSGSGNRNPEKATPSHDTSKAGGESPRVSPMPTGDNGQQSTSGTGPSESVKMAEAARQAATEKQTKAEAFRQEAERSRAEYTREQAETNQVQDNVDGANVSDSSVDQNNSVVAGDFGTGNSTVQEAESFAIQSVAMESLSQADSMQATAYEALESNDSRSYGIAMNQAGEYVTTATESYADAIREGAITSIPAEAGITISEDGTKAIYTGSGDKPITSRIDPYSFTPKAEAQQIGAASADAANAIRSSGLDRGGDAISRGYQSMVNAHQNNAASVDASLRGDHAMAREFHTRAENDIRTAAEHFHRGGAQGYEAARNSNISMQTRQNGGVNYTSSGLIPTKGSFTPRQVASRTNNSHSALKSNLGKPPRKR